MVAVAGSLFFECSERRVILCASRFTSAQVRLDVNCPHPPVTNLRTVHFVSIMHVDTILVCCIIILSVQELGLWAVSYKLTAPLVLVDLDTSTPTRAETFEATANFMNFTSTTFDNGSL